MKAITITLWLCISVFSVFAQTQPRSERYYTKEESIKIDELASFNMQYLLDEFTQGIVYFNDGDTVNQKLNYNSLLDEIHFYQDGKLMSLKSNQGIDSIKLADHLLVPMGPGYLEVFNTQNGPLYLHRRIDFDTEVITRGAYGAVEKTTATESVRNVYSKDGGAGQVSDKNDVRLANLSKDEVEVDLYYREMFLLYKDGRLMEIKNRRNLMDEYPENAKKIKSFIRKNKIDFKSAESLKKLASFLYTLS